MTRLRRWLYERLAGQTNMGIPAGAARRAREQRRHSMPFDWLARWLFSFLPEKLGDYLLREFDLG